MAEKAKRAVKKTTGSADKRVVGSAANPKKVAASSAANYKAPKAQTVKGAKRAGRPKKVS